MHCVFIGKLMTINRKWATLLIINICVIVVSFLFEGATIMTCVLVLWFDIMYYTISDFNNRSAFFAFAVSFFTFLIGREVMEVFGIHEIQYEFSESLNLLAHKIVLIGLISLVVGYWIGGHIRVGHRRLTRLVDTNSLEYKTIRYLCKNLFFVTYSALLLQVLDVIRYVFSHGYIAFYTGYNTALPYFFIKIGDMSIVTFWIYLATLPRKEEAKLPILMYAIYLIITLLTGKRYECVAGFLILFVYLLFRNSTDPDNKWIKTRHIVIVIILIPLATTILYAIRDIRVGGALTADTFSHGMTEFFYTQGISINVIKRMEKYIILLPEGKLYSFGATLDFLHNNLFSRLIGIKTYTGNTVEHAMFGSQLQHALSYVAMGSYYLEGHGLGSCYLAETYHDFGYIGVIICNVLYGIIFNRWMRFEGKGIWEFTIMLIAMRAFLLAPRGNADGFVASILDITTWGTILIVYFISKGLMGKHYESRI